MARKLTMAIALVQLAIVNLLHAYGYNTHLNFPASIQIRNIKKQEISSTKIFFKSETIYQIPSAAIKTKIKVSNTLALLLQTTQSVCKFTLGLIVSFILNIFKQKPKSQNGTLKANLASSISLQPEIIEVKNDNSIAVTMSPLATASNAVALSTTSSPKIEEKKAYSWFSHKLSEIRSRGIPSEGLTPTIVTSAQPEISANTVGKVVTELKSVKETLSAVSQLVTTAPAVNTTPPTISTPAPSTITMEPAIITSASPTFSTTAITTAPTIATTTTTPVISATISEPLAVSDNMIIPAVPSPDTAIIATETNLSTPAAPIIQQSIVNVEKAVADDSSTHSPSESSVSPSSTPASPFYSPSISSPEPEISSINAVTKHIEIFQTFPAVVSETSEDVLYMKYETGPYDLNAVDFSIDAETFKLPRVSIEIEGMEDLNAASDRIKSAGVSGAIAYAISEAGFWAASFPLIISSYHANTGDWLSINNPADRIVIFGLTAGFVSATRLALPLRLAAALSLLPAVDKFITPRIIKTADSTATSTSPTINTALSETRGKSK